MAEIAVNRFSKLKPCCTRVQNDFLKKLVFNILLLLGSKYARAHTSSMLGDSSEVDVEVVVVQSLVTTTFRLSVFGGGQLIWKLLLLVFPTFVTNNNYL